MGMLLSEKGIGRRADLVKAVLEVEEPKSASDVRSFLGLAGSYLTLPLYPNHCEGLQGKRHPLNLGWSRRRPLNVSNRRWQKLVLWHISIRMHPPR